MKLSFTHLPIDFNLLEAEFWGTFWLISATDYNSAEIVTLRNFNLSGFVN